MVRISWIDALKGIAISGVVMIHSGAAQMPFPVGEIGGIGDRGVQLFFLLSAYLAYKSLVDYTSGIQGKMRLPDVVRWWTKKFVRLMPLYYCAVMVGCLIGGDEYWLGNEGHITTKNIIAHVLFLHGFFPHYADSIIGVEWYLGVLAFFYILLPLIYKWIDRFEKAVAVFVGGIFVCSVVNQYALMHIGTEDTHVFQAYFGTFWIFAQLPILILGIILYYIIEKIDYSVIRSKKLLSYSLLVFAVLMICGHILGKNDIFMLDENTLFSFWFVCIIISQVLYRCPLIDNIIFRIIGRYSYPVYLFHYYVLMFYDKYLFDILGGGYGMLNWLIKYIISLCASVAMAVILTKCVDIPMSKWMKGMGVL